MITRKEAIKLCVLIDSFADATGSRALAEAKEPQADSLLWNAVCKRLTARDDALQEFIDSITEPPR